LIFYLRALLLHPVKSQNRSGINSSGFITRLVKFFILRFKNIAEVNSSLFHVFHFLSRVPITLDYQVFSLHLSGDVSRGTPFFQEELKEVAEVR
jgi:hypothetical protein